MKTKTDSLRRATVALLAAAAATALTATAAQAQSQPKEVKVAIVVPLSGPWARNGELHLKGAQLAVDQINAAGGIKALGGAKMKLVVGDAGDSTEKAKNAMQRVVSQNPDLSGGTGAFVSSFTLAVTEISERAEIPWLTLSYSDQITARGYKYVFQTSPTAGKQSADALPVVLEIAKHANAPTPKTIGIIQDNTASPASFTKPMREGGFDKLGLKLVADEAFTPPLSDATSRVQKVRTARPDLLLVLTTKVPDTKLVLEKLNEMGLGKGRLPVLTNGGHMAAPELLNVLGKHLDLRRHPVAERRHGDGRVGRSEAGGAGVAHDGQRRQRRALLSRQAPEVRRRRPAHGRGAGRPAMAGRRAEAGLSGIAGHRGADVAQALSENAAAPGASPRRRPITSGGGSGIEQLRCRVSTRWFRGHYQSRGVSKNPIRCA